MVYDVLILIVKMVLFIAAIDLMLGLIVWRVRGHNRAMDRRARIRRRKREEARKEEAYRALKIAQQNGLITPNEALTAEIPVQRKEEIRDVRHAR